YSVYNCIPLTFTYSSVNYLSEALHSGINFVNDSFPVGNGQFVQGFPQYILFNYLEYETHVVNMRTLYYFGKPLYNWYADILLLMGYPQGISATPNGTYVANPIVTENYVLSALENLFNYQLPVESQVLSGVPYTISLLNLSLKAYDLCNSSNSISISYSNTPKSVIPGTSAILPLPISLLFVYSNSIKLTPSTTCNQNQLEFDNCYPGFNYNLKLNTNSGNVQFSCCSPIPYSGFYNSTCFATIITNDSSLYSSLSNNGAECLSTTYNGVNAYECEVLYNFTSQFNKIVSEDSCPTSVDIKYNNNVYNFSQSFSTSHTFYGILYQYKELYNNYATNYSYWAFGIYNKTTLSGNYTIQAVLNVSGIYPSSFIMLSSYKNLSGTVYGIGIYGPNGLNSLYDLSDGRQLYQSPYYITPGQPFDIEILHNGSHINFFVNGIEEITQNLSALNNVSLIGVSTAGYPSSVSLSYIIGYYNQTNVYKSATSVTNVSQFEATSFGSKLLSATSYNSNSQLKSQLSSSDFINVIFLSQQQFKRPYLLQLELSNYFLPFNTTNAEVFGVYSSNNGYTYKNLYWFNLTPISFGSSIWINLTNKTPAYLIIAYGSGISNSVYHSATNTFPLIIYPGINGFNYFSYKLGNKRQLSGYNYSSTIGYIGGVKYNGTLSYSLNPIQFSQTGIIPDYIYNSTPNGYVYESFACVFNGKQSPIAYLLNVSYYAGKEGYNSQQEVYGYNEIYPQASIISSEEITQFSGATGHFIFNSNIISTSIRCEIEKTYAGDILRCFPT
ncbi:MAG: hypothetical protein QXF82_10360, partial [Nitrososphaeria archaeon]